MTDMYRSIQHHLDQAHHPDSLRALFCQTLNWGALSGSGQHLPRSGPDQEDLTAQPVATLGGVPVFRIAWPAEKPPTVTQRRGAQHSLSQVALEHILCYVTRDGRKTTIVWAKDRGRKRVELRTLPYEVGTPARTTIERLAMLGFTLDELGIFGDVSATMVLDRVNQAFDVEAVTRQFFGGYRGYFERAEQRITGIGGDERRMFTQKLFNRLMFIVFLERKGWLTFDGRTDYLRALWDDHQRERLGDPAANFYRDRLTFLFFAGLNTPHEVNVVDINRRGVLAARIGQVPYLNGGLFEEEATDRSDRITVPDEALEGVITDLFYAFNFTVSESTPFDIEVAVDPEMLGKIFEELITGRHESGSYYTPRPVVAFMCREGIKGYLAARLPDESPEVIARFVDERGAADLHDSEEMLAALKAVRVCDPACGSGAYLLGMLYELLSLRAGLFVTRKVDAITVYNRKLEIIQSNLYGVDCDPFAVNIARLRLWLSLAMEYEEGEPPPLPNLDYKMEVGDSLVAPDPSGGMQVDWVRQQAIDDYFALKEAYLRAHGEEKLALRERVEQQKRQIAEWTRGSSAVAGFDWQVEFAEVFADGGFDVVVANPPYVRQELIKALKPALKPVYPEVYTGTSDLYVYFYARALQMLRPGGMLVFISSNKWFRAGYGKKLRQHLAAQTRIHSITDFGDLPLFGATAYPVIFVGQKGAPEGTVLFTPVKELEPPYPDVLLLTQEQGEQLPPEAIQGESWLLTSSATARLVKQMEQHGTPLETYVQGQIYYGVKTGFNQAFVIDGATRAALIAQDAKSEEIIKPLAVGDDIRKWRIAQRDRWLIVTPVGIDIKRYSAVFAHLQQWQKELEKRWDKGKHWWELRACDYYDAFAQPKIIFPDIAKESRFAFDLDGLYVNNTSYFIPVDDLYLLSVLNSKVMWAYASERLTVLGDANKGGRLRFFRQFVEKLPIPDAPAAERKAIAKLAQQCVEAKGQGAQVAAWEAEIDARVARLFGVEEGEIGR